MPLWALGSNGHSQLSLNCTSDISKPTKVLLPPDFPTTPLSSLDLTIKCGGNHTLLLLSTGELFGCGSNEYHQLGLTNPTRVESDATKDVMVFSRIHETLNWKHVACGFNFSILVDDANRIFVTGTCSRGSLGLGPSLTSTTSTSTTTNSTSLHELQFPIPLHNRTITQLRIGMAHVIMVIDGCEVWGWGAGRKGNLGSGVTGIQYSPTLIHRGRIIDIAAGKDWTAILVPASSGSGEQHIITMPPDLSVTRFPIHLSPSPSPSSPPPPPSLRSGSCQAISCNWSTLHLLSTSHDNRNGCQISSLGRSDHAQHAPHRVPAVSHIASGTEHNLGLTALEGRVIAWGWNEHGNCGWPDHDDDDVSEAVRKGDVSDVRDLSSFISEAEVGQGGRFVGIAAGYGTSFFW